MFEANKLCRMIQVQRNSLNKNKQKREEGIPSSLFMTTTSNSSYSSMTKDTNNTYSSPSSFFIFNLDKSVATASNYSIHFLTILKLISKRKSFR